MGRERIMPPVAPAFAEERRGAVQGVEKKEA